MVRNKAVNSSCVIEVKNEIKLNKLKEIHHKIKGQLVNDKSDQRGETEKRLFF